LRSTAGPSARCLPSYPAPELETSQNELNDAKKGWFRRPGGRAAAGQPEIAARLFLSHHTIKTHINRIFAKTGSRDRAAAIGYAYRHGIS
jgi:hypothetical protein